MPNAPAPVYDSAGNVVVAWSTTIAYDPIADLITLHWTQAAGPYHRAASGVATYDPQEPQQARDALLLRYGILSARRLF